MKVAEVMSKDIVACHPHTTLAVAATLMSARNIGFLPVTDLATGRVLGVITDRDVMLATYRKGKRVRAVPVGTPMSLAVKTVRASASVEEAEEIMSRHRVRRLPVVDDAGKLVGILSIDDIASRAALEGDELLEREVAVALGAIASPRT